MKRVFLGGSRRVSRLNDSIRRRLEEIVRREMQVVVGDANGADKALQRQLADWRYPDVVYHVGARPRNSEGAWPTMRIAAGAGARGFEFYAVKDRAMANDAECGLMLWDGESRGTLANVENLAAAGKPVAVYVRPQRRFMNVLDTSDVDVLRAAGTGATVGEVAPEQDAQQRLGLPYDTVTAAHRRHRRTA